MSEIPIVLASNASWQEFPENTNSHFKLRLAKPIKIEAKRYKVGLMDAHFSRTWRNIAQSYLTVRTRLRRDPPHIFTQRKVAIRSGRYKKMADIVDEIQRALTSCNLEKHIEVYHDEVRNSVNLMLLASERDETTRYLVSFNTHLASVLGLRSDHFYTKDSAGQMSIPGVSAPNLDGATTTLFVYCDLVAPYRVADTLAPLLRIIPVRGGKKMDIYEEVRNVLWLDAEMGEKDVIEVNIRHDDGTPVAFEGGKVILNVMLKPV